MQAINGVTPPLHFVIGNIVEDIQKLFLHSDKITFQLCRRSVNTMTDRIAKKPARDCPIIFT